jgi:SlyX protein
MDNLEERVTELEIRVAMQDELLDSLNQTIARMQNDSDLLQAQLRLMYRKMTEDQSGEDGPRNLADEIPPHY